MPIVSLEEATNILSSGGLLVFPTETVFGIGCSPTSVDGVEALLDIKERGSSQGMPLIISERSQIDQLVIDGSEQLREQRRSLESKYWPGPLTLVVDASPALNFVAGVAAADNSIAVRLSSLLLARTLAAAAGGVLIATSANRRGESPALRTETALELFPDLPVLAGDCAAASKPSTIIDVRSVPPRLIRSGAIEPERQWLS